MYRDRRYDAAEVRAILARAAQGKGGQLDAPPRTLEEIEALGEELGLSREAVRAAATTTSAPAPIAPRTFGEDLRGGPARIRHDVVVPGRIDASKHEALVELLRDRFGAAGHVELLGETLTWTFGGQNARFVTIRMKPTEGGTSIRYEETLGPLAGGLYGGLMGGLGGGLGGGLSPLLPLVLHWPAWTIPLWIVLTVGVAYLLARTIFARTAAKRAVDAEAVVQALVRELDAPPVRIGAPTRVATDDAEQDEGSELEPARTISRDAP